MYSGYVLEKREGQVRRKQKVSGAVRNRWTPELVEEGFTPISTFFLDNYSRLRNPLTSQEVVFILHLVRFKWDERHPFPSFETLAERMGTSYNHVRSQATSLVSKGYLRKVRRRTRLEFDLHPLFDELGSLRRSMRSAGADAQ